MKRRNFLHLAGASAVLAFFHGHASAAPIGNNRKAHAITGTWFEFQHHSEVEGTYWNPALAAFTADDWEAKVAEIAGTGIRYLVLLDVAIYGKSFYPSALLPQHALTDNDPMETVL